MNNQDNTTKVWVSLEDLTQDANQVSASELEFPAHENHDESNHSDASRRDFLKYVGFGVGAATLASCEIPVKKAIPFLVKPEEIVPGIATYYASTFVKGSECLPVLVKTREGRPIKIEGHPMAYAKGGTSARAQASVLELYDTDRLKSAGKVEINKSGKPQVKEISWEEIDKEIISKLSVAKSIKIVSHSVISPSLLGAIELFKSKYPNTEHVQYEPFSNSCLLDANAQMFGNRVVPNYRFDIAKCIVAIECDFLGTWISPVEYAADYSKNRILSDEQIAQATKEMSVHVQMEAGMSLTGSNADHRILLKPSEYSSAVQMLFNEVAALTGNGTASSAQFSWKKATAAIKSAAKKLVENKGKSLVVCGINDLNIQKAVNGINIMLESYGSTILWSEYCKQRKENDESVSKLVAELGSADVVIIMDANPAFDMPSKAKAFSDAIKNLTKSGKLTLSLSSQMTDTAALCSHVAPDHNFLESWGDVNPKQGHFYLIQPTIKPLFKTRSIGQSFLTWAGAELMGDQPYYEFLKSNWKKNLLTAQDKYITVQAFWENVLHDGMLILSDASSEPKNFITLAVAADTNKTQNSTANTSNTDNKSANALDQSKLAASTLSSSGSNSKWEISLYETVNMGSGQYANNPWLQEMPDPVRRTTWDNFLSIPIEWDGDNNYKTPFGNLVDGDLVELTINDTKYTLPVIRQFGQHKNVLSVALGYGRDIAGKAGSKVGVNLFNSCDGFTYHITKVSEPKKVGHDDMFASVQMHHTYGLKNKNKEGKEINVDEQVLGHRGFQGSLTNRSVFFQSTASDLQKGVEDLKEKRKEYQYLNSKGLYPSREEVYTMGHWWAMSIDLNACVGCGACTVACMSENNVPVVGKFEVSKSHELTWLRIDRYFYGDEETPNTAYMPMMCQHCDNAPCENVCPVAATNHSSEGLNQMTYNRCIGTRYCANNCPFKVRRFNWLDYTSADIFPVNEVDMNRGMENDEYYTYMTDNLTRMVLNPDVTVRSRGVIEKCSFCVQRLQEAKLTAKVEGRRLRDGDVKVACQSACPTGAIVFGDRNDKESKVSKWMNSHRGYLALEEVNVRSSVTYLMKVVNKDSKFTA